MVNILLDVVSLVLSILLLVFSSRQVLPLVLLFQDGYLLGQATKLLKPKKVHYQMIQEHGLLQWLSSLL
eukprot:jgi/Orpsp1_1/1174446/evm.model.c7180000050131.1